jgi:transposase
MKKDMSVSVLPKGISLGPNLDRVQAEAIYARGKEAVIFTILELAKQLAETRNPASTTPSTPSGMIPVYEKPAVSRRNKRPGRKNGHSGSGRKRPERIDRREEHRLPCCPHCHGRLKRMQETHTRYVEDIPENLQAEVTEHTIHRDWCPKCKKRVTPQVPDALPGARLGNRAVVLSAWMHYGLGTTLQQIVDVFNHHLQMKVTKGGLVQAWYRLQEVFCAWYEQIQQEGLSSAVLHGDETGWRVNGKTHWLWCFSNERLTYYLIDRSRGEPALRKFFVEEFKGTLISDFWGAYNAIVGGPRQKCLVHLFRDLEHVEKYKNPGKHWAGFAKKLRRLLGDAIRLWKREERPPPEYASRRACLDRRLRELIETDWRDPQADRLIKRLRRHQNELFTFLDHADVPFENNHAERAIRPAVIIRKNSYANRSNRGSDAQAVLMSIFRTLKQRGCDLLDSITQALKTYLTSGKLPPLPP